MSDVSDCDSSDDLNDTPSDINLDVKETYSTLLRQKTKSKYEFCYKKFMEWTLVNGITNISENIVTAYMKKMSSEIKPSTLWTTYSMLKTMINIKNNIDISTYPKLRNFLKLQSNGYKSKKSKILTPEQIKKFLLEAPDVEYLFTKEKQILSNRSESQKVLPKIVELLPKTKEKVVLIFGISGGCRRQELKNLKINHVSDLENELHVKLVDTKPDRIFVIPGMFYEVCKKYIQLRPPDMTQFFVNYQKGKCTKQVVGVNKIGNQPKIIAEYLKLPESELYTGHCFRRSRVTILADAGDDTLTVNNFGVWKSTASSVMQTYIEHSLFKKIEIANIVRSFDTQPEAAPSTSNQNIHPNLVQSTSSYNSVTEDNYEDIKKETETYETSNQNNILTNLLQSTSTYNSVTEDNYEDFKKETETYETSNQNILTNLLQSTSTYNSATEDSYEDLKQENVTFETSNQNIRPNLIHSTSTYNNVIENNYEDLRKETVKYENCTFNNCTFIVKISD